MTKLMRTKQSVPVFMGHLGRYDKN